MNIHEIVASIEPEIQKVRCQIHRDPELGMSEYHTSALIEKELKEKTKADRIERIGETGWLVEIKGTKVGLDRTIVLRGDMDALPIQEAADHEQRSQVNGVMHACGHDVHTSILLGAVRVLEHYRDQISGSVLFFFQPGEELLKGAKLFVESPKVDFSKIDGVAACHVSPELDAGMIAVRNGAILASADELLITIKGKSGHGAHPDTVVDPIAIAAQVISTLQMLVSREVEPSEAAVISICKIHGGNATNIIPDQVEMGGTVRAVTKETRVHLLQRIPQVCAGIAAAMRAEAEVELKLGPPPFVCEPEWVDRVRRSAGRLLGEKQVIELAAPSMGAEDFAYIKEKAPGVFVRLGARTPGGPYGSIHSPGFYCDRKALTTGILTLAGIVLDFFEAEYES